MCFQEGKLLNKMEDDGHGAVHLCTSSRADMVAGA
uniref:Predicted protein n=1 Tax=Hordeum vulgare subsp. vulgare TaxID=112509 RepID=F2E183_HORVV|nr:predicted protein [Hordeum vulgare subsp. vulgare]